MIQYRDLLSSKKYNSEEKKVLLTGIIPNLILSREIFPSNATLKDYVIIFEKLLTDEKEFRDYLFQSRTLLSSRITRLLIENEDSTIDKFYINWHIQFLDKLTHNTAGKNIKNSNDTLLTDFLKEREKHK